MEPSGEHTRELIKKIVDEKLIVHHTIVAHDVKCPKYQASIDVVSVNSYLFVNCPECLRKRPMRSTNLVVKNGVMTRRC